MTISSRFAYDGVSRHQNVKHLVKDKWNKYAKCIEDVVTLKEAKKCAAEKEEDKPEKESEVENQQQEEGKTKPAKE